MINIAEMIGMGQKNIFFIEAEESLTEFHPRLLCAFESAALHNPDHLVISKNAVFVWSPLVISFFIQVFVLVSATAMLNNVPSYFEQNYTNLVFAKVNFTQFLAATPASKYWSSNDINAGYGLENIGDVLRVVLVLLFGGTYFDTDVISLKTIPDQEKVCKCMFFYFRANQTQV